MKPDEYEVELIAGVYGGDALGRLPDGRAVFVPYALAGERIRLQLVEEKRGHARARLLEVLVPSAQRVRPRCPHFAVCGGCHYQHIDYSEQVSLKTGILRQQLERIAGVAGPPVRPMRAAPQPWNYRNTIQFHLDAQGKPGYHKAGSREVAAVLECHLPEAALNAIWPQLQIEPEAGIQRLELRLGSEEDILLTLEGSGSAPEFELDLPLSAVYQGPGGACVLAGDDHIVMTIHERRFKVSAASFFQTNTLQAAALIDYLLAHLPLSPNTIFLDLYCGVGLFSAFAAGRVGRCVGIELSPSACQDFADNLDEFDNVELYQGAVEEILPGLKLHPDVIVADPPRAGLARGVCDALAALKAPYLAYISCDPATLARDTARLISGGYRLKEVFPFDFFPQTYHIESASIFTR